MHLVRRRMLAGAAAAGLAAGSAHAQTPGRLGEWVGQLDLGSRRLRPRLVLTEGPRATFYGLDRGEAAIAAIATAIEGDRISIDLSSIGARYQGRFAAGRIEGAFIQARTFALTFARQGSQAGPPQPTLTQARLEALRAQAGCPAMAAAGANRDGRALVFAVGLRALARPELVRRNDRWHLGSITKSMTATLAARLVEAGRVSWDDSVGAVLGGLIPEMRAEYRDASLLHLLSHRAGLGDTIALAELLAFPRQSADARQERIAYARLGLTRAASGAAGGGFVYSNTGYVIAGAMLEAKLGAPWEELMRQHVFAPLGMDSAGFGAPGAAGAHDEPVGHGPGLEAIAAGHDDGALRPVFPGEDADNPAVLGPAARAHANLSDTLIYLGAHRDRSAFLTRQSWAILHADPFGGGYGLGWFKRENGALWHNGSNTLWYAEALVDPSRGLASVAAANDGRIGNVSGPVGAALLGAAQAVL